MLRALDIRDILIIDHLEIAFQPGLNVLTGETGAGKSILLDSLGFVLGWRGRAELVRQGAEQGEVTAVFELPKVHPARHVLHDVGLPVEDELILRRVNTSEGRKTAWINDRRVSGEVLRRLSDTLVELHGQHDDRGLLNPRGHRDLLDEFAGVEDARRATRQAWSAAREARRVVAETESALQAVREEEEFLRHAVAELDGLSPEAGEDGDLDTRRRQMQAAEKIRTDITRANALMGEQGAEAALSEALRWLDAVAEHANGTLDAPLAALNRAMIELSEAQSGVEASLETLDFDPTELEQVEERLFAIRALARKHNEAPDDLADFGDKLRAKLAALDAGDADLATQKKALKQAEADYEQAAQKLSNARREAAGRLDTAIMAELAPLKMERAVFATEITPGEAGPDGTDAVAFTVATNPGAPSGPLNKIASGGELSRFLLALKVCLTGTNAGVTMIFDEIDRGVGGATADAVGRRLAALADKGQVLVVTHSPQVAARGAHHWRVMKQVAEDVTLSTVIPVAKADRVDEIARMLAGDTITKEARAAAKALLQG